MQTALAVEGLASTSKRSYLAGVRHAQIERGGPDPQWLEMGKLEVGHEGRSSGKL